MLVVASGALIAMACGGGDKKATATDAPASSETSVATTVARARSTSTPKPSATKASSSLPQAAGTPVGGSASSKSFGTIFSSLFGGAFSGAGAPDGLGEGDPGLKQYLPDASDFPSGYETMGQHTFRTPDGISNSGGMDIAAEKPDSTCCVPGCCP